MKGRTYRYFKGSVQYPFGYGLSYTSFNYNWKQEPLTKYSLNDNISFSVTTANAGNLDGDEVVQAYIEYPSVDGMPSKELKAFKKVHVAKGNAAEVTLTIPVSELQKWDASTNKWKLYKGSYNIYLGKNANEVILKKSFSIK